MELVVEETVISSHTRRGARPLSIGALIAALAVGLTGCSESISAVSVPSFSELMRGYDETLTAEERKDAIAELQKDQVQAKASGKAKASKD